MSKAKIQGFIPFLLIFLGFEISQAQEEQAIRVPEWAIGAVWYQIFPERFRNGDLKNDPTAAEVLGADSGAWHISPWTANWYALQPWEKQHSRDFYKNVFRRRYGGDLVGVIEKLDYLADLGVTAIYFNPIFEARSLHKYDGSSYHHVDNNFGSDRDGDWRLMQTEVKDTTAWAWSSADRMFLQLIREAHARGIRIIIDGVFNHVGRDFWAFADVLKRKQASKYKNWFMIRRWDDPTTPQDEFDYASWWNVRSLPEFREDRNGLVEGPKKYIWAITRRWMDPNGDGNPDDGVDGWRLDVATDIAPAFWRQWCTYARKLNPDVYLTAELWQPSPDWIGNPMFHAVMNYPFARMVVKFFINKKDKLKPGQMQKEMKQLLKIYSPQTNLILMNLIDSHDTDRIASMIRNPDRPYDRLADPRSNPAYDVRKPTANDLKIQKMIAVFQCAFPGAPMIYYGDEAGMWGADDPDDRKPMVWPDFNYEPESYESIGKPGGPDAVAFNADLHAFYRTVFSSRKKHPALRQGKMKFLLADDVRKLLGFSRYTNQDTVLAYFNKDRQKHEIRLPGASSGWKDILGNKIFASGTGFWILNLPAQSAAFVEQKSEHGKR